MQSSARRRRGSHSKVETIDPPKGVAELVDEYDGLSWDDGLFGGDSILFIGMDFLEEVVPPHELPYMIDDGEERIYFLVPSDNDLPDRWVKEATRRIAIDLIGEAPSVSIPDDENWPTADQIATHLNEYWHSFIEAKTIRDCTAILEREREVSSGLYASAAPIEDTAPMLIDGLVRERGVSVIYGAFDEFKTTLVLDMMAHVAMGVPWQGRAVKPRPVIWYALEGADEIPVRMRAFEANISKQSSLWGDDRAPVTVLDRLPDDYRNWRKEIYDLAKRWENVRDARAKTEGLDWHSDKPSYPEIDIYDGTGLPVVVIDTLSMALGDDDEKGPKAVGFINECLDLLKEHPDLDPSKFGEDEEDGIVGPNHPGKTVHGMGMPVAAHVIIIHHQTKTSTDFAGHRAIAANTQGLFRVHRFGKITDADRPYAGQFTPQRVKGIPRPAPLRFEVTVVPVEGTKQTAAILKQEARIVPDRLKPVIQALRELDEPQKVTPENLNNCIDSHGIKKKVSDDAKRKVRERRRKELEEAGVIEPVEDDNGRVEYYRFHDPHPG